MRKKRLYFGLIAFVLLVGGYQITTSFLFPPSIVIHDAIPITQDSVHEKSQMLTVKKVFPVSQTIGHPATGTLHVLQDDTTTVLRYENYKTINGPDLFVYLSKDLDATDIVDLGHVKGTEGDINYEIPHGVEITEYRYVLTWCKQFGVLFNYVDLHQLHVGDEIATQDPETPVLSVGNATTSATDIQTDQKKLPTDRQTAIFGNGCFWCVEHDLEAVTGVLDVVSGYSGGSTTEPTYKNYAQGGHREVVQVTYDANIVSYGNLVEHVLKHGDPTDAKGSFGDRGVQYAPALYYANDTEMREAQHVVEAINNLKVFPNALVIKIIPRMTFWEAEEYHQDYSERNPIRYYGYRAASGRDAFIRKYWGESRNNLFEVTSLPEVNMITMYTTRSWDTFIKPDQDTLRATLTPRAYAVTQEEGTEPAGSHPYDKLFDNGIYVDVVSGEPLFSSRDKYDSGTGWPSFVQPMSNDAVTLHEDKRLFSTRTEVRSRFADSHLGHVFSDGPQDRGGMRYCMNGVALRFISEADMEKEGYAYLLNSV
jgi:peptide methionine sulfoxide reductase msrA/msrB